MASGNTNANNTGSVKEQLLVCWLEPQSDAGKVSAIPASWIVSAVSGDGRSPNSVVRCRWPRTKRLYRARIVPSAEQSGAKAAKDDNEAEESEDFVEQARSRDETKPKDEPLTASFGNMVKEETKPIRNLQSQATMSSSSQQNSHVVGTGAQASPAVDASALAQVLLPTLKKLFNSELSKLSTDIQANFDIIGHKISALDGTVKCIKTRVDRMETLLNTAAQELGDSQGLSNANLNLNSRSSPLTLSGADLLTGAARNLSFSNMRSYGNSLNTGIHSPQQQGSNRNFGDSASSNRPGSSSNAALSRGSGLSANSSNAVPQRRSASGQNRIGNQDQQSRSNRGQPATTTSGVSSYSRHTPLSMVTTGQRPQIGQSASGPLKRRRTTQTTNPPLPKAVVVTAPNGIEIYLGGDKNYKMPLVMYKDALKNCTRPSPTYMVMALIRRYLTPDEMSRTWLTEQQLLGKKDGMLLDQSLLSALKKQSLMQFPGSGIDDRLLVRKLYDVFHGIRRQMRKKHREAGELGFNQVGLMGVYGQGECGTGLGAIGVVDDEDSGSANEHDDAMDDDSHQIEHGSGDYDDDTGNNFQADGFGHGQRELVGTDGAGDNFEGEEDGDECADGSVDDGCALNGDEDLEEMAARQAAFWAGADDNY